MKKYPMKLVPVLRDTIWGGNKLREYGIESDADRIAEAWMLTVRPDGMSVVANGEYSGMKLCDVLGTPQNNDGEYDFPLLVKFIDARQDLSVQVHPAKTELWYIIEADEGAKLVYGLKDDFDEKTFREAVAEGKLDSLLHTVNVHAGEYYLLPSGQIHAICAGILIAEFQQNSNVTYRVWDYNRGREIHTEAAIDTMKKLKVNGDFSGMCESEFFKVEKYEISGKFAAERNGAAFTNILVISGEGSICGERFSKGDSFILPGNAYDGDNIPIEIESAGCTLMLCEPKSVG